METQVLLATALRAVGVYVLVLVVVRLMGKRTVGNFSAFDLLVALMIGEVVDEMIYGDVSMLQGAIPIVVVALLHEANAWLSTGITASSGCSKASPRSSSAAAISNARGCAPSG